MTKQTFSLQSKHFGPYADIFSPRPFIVELLKEAWDRHSLIDTQNFALADCTLPCTFNVHSFTLHFKQL